MVKAKKYFFLSLFLPFVLIISSCDNFLGGADVKEQLDSSIKYANSPVFTVRIAPEDLSVILSLPVYDENNKKIPYDKTNIRIYRQSKNAKISTDYYLLGNGEIALVYHPYALAPYSYGFTHFVIKTDMIDYFNRKNP